MVLATNSEMITTKIFPKDIYKKVRLGRNKENEVILDGYAFSRIHTTFYNYNEDWFIIDGYSDKSSTNGTWIYLDNDWNIVDNISLRVGLDDLKIEKIDL